MVNGDPLCVPATVRLNCLAAVDSLHAAGVGDLPRVETAPVDPQSGVVEALQLLAQLPVAWFTRPAVLDAVAAARAALHEAD